MSLMLPPPGRQFAAGLAAIAPLIVAVVPIGALFGTVAVTKGLSPVEAVAMSAFVFAGGSQFVAMDLWTEPAPWLALGFSALLVNMRHMLMSVSILPKLGRFGRPQRLLALLSLTDETWAVAEDKAGTQGLTPAWYAGLVLPFYAAWVCSTAAGALLGAHIADPTAIGLDFAFPAVFIVLLMNFWQGARTGAVLLASGGAAVAVHALVPGVWYIMAGALAGLAVAALFPARPEEARA